MPPPPDDLARELRAAVLASDHEKAARLTVEYTAALADYWKTLSARERAASPLPEQSLQLLTWAREMTIVHGAMAGEHLKLIAKARRYQTARALYQESASLGPR
jgi:hypothetical protein